MENNSDTPQRFSTVRRELPGCRPCGLNWDKCKVHLMEHDDTLAISFEMENFSWKRRLEMKNGVLQCDLQELAVLRWIDHSRNYSVSGIQPRDYKVEYASQERYKCLFPHSPAEVHDVLEVVRGMSTEHLRDLAAPCCDSSHDVEEEVHTLAGYWPTRQILNAPATDGFVDIVPVMVCENTPDGSGCNPFSWAEPTSSPTRIRIAMSPKDMLWYIGDTGTNSYRGKISENEIANPDVAIHESWHIDIRHATQPAVLRCRHRKSRERPTRLYDAQERANKRHLGPVDYLALSYCWHEWPVEDTLKNKVGELSRKLGMRYFWVDRWCIDQDDAEDKKREIPHMRGYYEGSSGCVVLTKDNMQSFQCLPRHDGAILSAYQQLMINRIWTMQEALMSRQVIYAINDQLVDGDYISELMAYIQTFSEMYVGDYYNAKWVGGYGCYGWNARLPSVIRPRQFSFRNRPEVLTVTRSIFGGERQYKELKSHGGLQMPLEQALVVVEGRNASRKEDHIYGILGITEGGHKIEAEYGIPWVKMLSKLQAAGMLTERQLASPTVNALSGMSWLPACGPYYGPFTQMDRLASFVKSPPIDYSDKGAKVFGAVFHWVEPAIEDWAVFNGQGMTCRIVRGTIKFPTVSGLSALVSGTSTQGFTSQRLEGTHVLLSSGLDENSTDGVVMVVGGNVESGQVYRVDGYVLEFRHWNSGDFNQLEGRQWLVGSKPF
ncbi:hypothetical protein FMEXI_5865 [Fusarium mexicanum]|uniref:Heterokaryon incompatibility domain-containing protein n=1 Tax=Fusarium mexicanum TaxID=751941 RepID=A0A8H5MYM0_9HYPO|nr:hypothetical protein FMEXI_5865 [Fusarium mexicanum]